MTHDLISQSVYQFIAISSRIDALIGGTLVGFFDHLQDANAKRTFIFDNFIDRLTFDRRIKILNRYLMQFRPSLWSLYADVLTRDLDWLRKVRNACAHQLLHTTTTDQTGHTVTQFTLVKSKSSSTPSDVTTITENDLKRAQELYGFLSQKVFLDINISSDDPKKDIDSPESA